MNEERNTAATRTWIPRRGKKFRNVELTFYRCLGQAAEHELLTWNQTEEVVEPTRLSVGAP